ncbi:hypothetical protein AC626_22980 [Pseudoalteromonas rubra]|uniref:Uncharacterized protein n=1 Tax=Pseudoalteromonas rubra TaxID=43658 RepID=A0A0L0EM71_9GAMM|nr:hypothetical protein AC626_22980 [Pseudoalteromonas rubra]
MQLKTRLTVILGLTALAPMLVIFLLAMLHSTEQAKRLSISAAQAKVYNAAAISTAISLSAKRSGDPGTSTNLKIMDFADISPICNQKSRP